MPFPLKTQLLQLNPWHQTRQHEHTGQNNGPMLDMSHIQIIRRPTRRTHGRKSQRRNHIPADPVVLVRGLCIINAAIQRRCIVLCEPHDSLKEDGDVECKAEDGMRGLKVFVSGTGLVDLDDHKADEERGYADEVEEEVGQGAGAFLGGGVRGLEDESGLGYEEETSRVEQRM